MKKEKLKVINLFGGPGSGKSTTRAGLFHLMKLEGMEVEEVTEFAKDLTWEKRFHALSDSLYVVSKQNHRIHRLVGQVEWVISDSPLWVATAYNNYIHQGTYEALIEEIWDKYENYNFFIKRVKNYNPNGRNQTEEEAIKIDNDLMGLLDSRDIPYTVVEGNHSTPHIILNKILEK